VAARRLHPQPLHHQPRRRKGGDRCLHLPRRLRPTARRRREPDTFWAAGDGTTSGRLEVDLGGATSVRIVDLSEPIALGERSKKYHVEVQAPRWTTWTTIATGTVIGQRNLIRVNPPRMAEKIAVVVEDARGVPAIAEFAVY
jgi:alpha-L-fucosidase